MYHQAITMSAKTIEDTSGGWVGLISNLTLEKNHCEMSSRWAAIQALSLPRKQQQEVYNFIMLRFCASHHDYHVTHKDIVRGWRSVFLPSLRPRDYLCATGSFSGEVNMNVNVDSEEENCKLAMGTAAATVGHRAYID